jgi:hypothetical protein
MSLGREQVKLMVYTFKGENKIIMGEILCHIVLKYMD